MYCEAQKIFHPIAMPFDKNTKLKAFSTYVRVLSLFFSRAEYFKDNILISSFCPSFWHCMHKDYRFISDCIVHVVAGYHFCTNCSSKSGELRYICTPSELVLIDSERQINWSIIVIIGLKVTWGISLSRFFIACHWFLL